MKILTQKKSKKYSPEYGWLIQITFYIFGFKIWTENHFIDEIINVVDERKATHDLEEMALYQEWRAKMKMTRLSDDDFIQILNSRF